MMLSNEKLRSFCFEVLPHSKRKQVNQAFRSGLIVKNILSIEDHWKSLQAVFMSTAQRTQYGLPKEYYIEKTEEWKRGLRREFALPGRDWFGVWRADELIGYLYSCLIDDVAFLLVTKFNSDYREARPSDALLYHVLSYYKDKPGCHAVTAGEANPMVPSIDHFKKSYGFEEIHYPAFSHISLFVKTAIQGALVCGAIAVKWQPADSKRNLRYKLETLRRGLTRWQKVMESTHKRDEIISEETFALEEKRLGKQVHFHDGIWWVKAAPFYYKPLNEFRPFPPRSARPHPLKALGGYSHQVPYPAQATRFAVWNVLDGENLAHFSMERLKSKRRNMVRGGMRDCRVEEIRPDDVIVEQMRQINISQARRFAAIGEEGFFLPPDYYESRAGQWREDMLKLFGHKGHQFLGAFVEDKLAAYIYLIKIEDTWLFGAVKSNEEYLRHRPVDALYFHVLTMASQSGECKRVVNGGGPNERETLTRFKEEFLLVPVSFPYYSQTFLPLDRLRKIKSLFTRRRLEKHKLKEEVKA